MKTNMQTHKAFTIIELLVVVVVISILASLTLATYSNIYSKATEASLSSDLSNAATLLKMSQISYGKYPTTTDCSQTDSSTNKCIKPSAGVSFQYIPNNDSSPKSFCIAAMKNGITYKLTDNTNYSVGDCQSFGIVLHYDSGNPLSYPGSGTTLIDLSGNLNDGILMGGVTYSSVNGGVLMFDGVDDFIESGTNNILSSKPFTLSAWFINDVVNRYSGAISIGSSGGLMSAYIGTVSSAQVGSSNSIGGGYYGKNYGSSISSTGTYVNVFMTFTGGAGGLTTLYVNGISRATGNDTPNLTANYRRIGRIGSDMAYNFDGSISEVYIFNRALTSSDITQRFNESRSRYGI